MKVNDIARIVHEANKAYCESIGDFSQAPWNLAEPWQRASAVAGVQQILDNPDTTPKESHEGWLKMKEAEGWKYGKIKRPDIKQHPCMVPYDRLPKEQKIKDELFGVIVRVFIGIPLEVIASDKAIKPTDEKVDMNSADAEAIDMEFNPDKTLEKKASFFSKLSAKLKDTSK